MSFQEAENSEQMLQGITDILRQALEEPGYERNPNQVYDNMDADPLINSLPQSGRQHSRVDLLRRVNPLRTNPSAIPGKVVEFCCENLQQGPAVAHSVFGRVQSLKSLVNTVVGASSGKVDRLFESRIRDLVFSTDDDATKLARQKLFFSGKNMSQYQMWSYAAADPDNPFSEIGTARADAVDVLGLGVYSNDNNETLVRWAHRLPETIKACQPTAWDAGTDKGNVYWRPGGRTYRLGVDDYGVPEVVHNPIQGEALIAPIKPLS